jgi:hypothetical protein
MNFKYINKLEGAILVFRRKLGVQWPETFCKINCELSSIHMQWAILFNSSGSNGGSHICMSFYYFLLPPPSLPSSSAHRFANNIYPFHTSVHLWEGLKEGYWSHFTKIKWLFHDSRRKINQCQGNKMLLLKYYNLFCLYLPHSVVSNIMEVVQFMQFSGP